MTSEMNKGMHTSLAAVFTAFSSILQGKEFLEQEEKQNKKVSFFTSPLKNHGSITQAIQTMLEAAINILTNTFQKHRWNQAVKLKKIIIVHHASHIEHPNNIGYSFVIHPTVSTIFYLNTENKIKTLKKLKLRIYEKTICIKGGTKHISNIFTLTVQSLLGNMKKQLKLTWLLFYLCFPKHRWGHSAHIEKA